MTIAAASTLAQPAERRYRTKPHADFNPVKPPKAICFDIDGTLVDFHWMLNHALQAVANALQGHFSRPVSVNDLQDRRNQLARTAKFSAAKLDDIRQASFKNIVDEWGGDNALYDRLCTLFFEARRQHRRLYPEVLPTLEFLQQSGIRLLAASNGNTDLSGTPVEGYLETVIYAQQLGISKPALGFFEHVRQQTSVFGKQLWHIGDTWHEDYLPADMAGLTSVWLNRLEQPAPQQALTVTHLWHLPGLWERI